MNELLLEKLAAMTAERNAYRDMAYGRRIMLLAPLGVMRDKAADIRHADGVALVERAKDVLRGLGINPESTEHMP